MSRLDDLYKAIETMRRERLSTADLETKVSLAEEEIIKKGGTGSSRARELHPHPLTEPCVKVSPHTALHIQRFGHRHNLGV